MLTTAELAELPPFADLSADELAWLLANGSEQALAEGEYFVREGDPSDRFYVVLAGELQITRVNEGKEAVMGTTPRGIMGGEMSILNNVPSNISARALMATRLIVFPLAVFRQIFATTPSLGTRVLQTAAQRMQGYAAMRHQQEKLAALGKLSAGLAHELNNPASAARRAAGSLREALPGLMERTLLLCKLGLSAAQIDQLAAAQQQLITRRASLAPLASLARSDREDALGDWLDAQGVPGAYELAATLVEGGVTADELSRLAAELPPAAIADAISWIAEAAASDGLLGEIEISTRRIADLVGAVKSYSYMDQGAMQEVEINRDLEHTLAVLGHRIGKQVEVRREYDPALPKLMGRGGELNQVWTNLIVNALEAMEHSGVLRLITRYEQDFIMVEVADSGSGIPPEVQPRIFEPFFTTKGVGQGTGLGLDISYRIITQHHGTIEVQSQPGNTRFIVRLPVAAALSLV